MIRRFSMWVTVVLMVCAGTALAAQASDRGDARAVAYFAGGCFWCTEADFEKLPGVLEAVSGYMGGAKPNPTYQEVSAGGTGHTESVRVVYDPEKVSYSQLLRHFWHNVDPTVKDRQFCDSGSQYRSAVFYADDAQKAAAEQSLADLKSSGRFAKIYTELAPATTFYVAEDYHQDYYKKNPIRYHWYRSGCGRDKRLKELWGDEAGH